MGYIKEPTGIDFIVDPTPLTNKDRKQITDVIAYFKTTGKVLTLSKVNIKAKKLNKKLKSSTV